MTLPPDSDEPEDEDEDDDEFEPLSYSCVNCDYEGADTDFIRSDDGLICPSCKSTDVFESDDEDDDCND